MIVYVYPFSELNRVIPLNKTRKMENMFIRYCFASCFFLNQYCFVSKTEVNTLKLSTGMPSDPFY